MSRRHPGRLAVCIGCGCDDFNACKFGCFWMRVDYERRIGVCSNCPAKVAEFDKGIAPKKNPRGGAVECNRDDLASPRRQVRR
jgi:hypothetical protein